MQGYECEALRGATNLTHRLESLVVEADSRQLHNQNCSLPKLRHLLLAAGLNVTFANMLTEASFFAYKGPMGWLPPQTKRSAVHIG